MAKFSRAAAQKYQPCSWVVLAVYFIHSSHLFLSPYPVSIANVSSIVTWPSYFTITFLSSNTPGLINGVALVIPVWLTIILISRAVDKSTFVESKTSPSPKRFESESRPSPKRFESESSPSPKRFESKSSPSPNETVKTEKEKNYLLQNHIIIDN